MFADPESVVSVLFCFYFLGLVEVVGSCSPLESRADGLEHEKDEDQGNHGAENDEVGVLLEDGHRGFGDLDGLPAGHESP